MQTVYMTPAAIFKLPRFTVSIEKTEPTEQTTRLVTVSLDNLQREGKERGGQVGYEGRVRIIDKANDYMYESVHDTYFEAYEAFKKAVDHVVIGAMWAFDF